MTPDNSPIQDKRLYKYSAERKTIKQYFEPPKSEYYHYVSGGLRTGDPAQPGIQSHTNPEWDEYEMKCKLAFEIHANELTAEDGAILEEGKDFKIYGEFFKGNYHNICAVCKKEFAGADKLWFLCPEHSVKAIPIQDKQPEQKTGSEERACPCKYLDEPCHPKCTCVFGGSSIGCRYCATYGSLEQRKNAAERIANAIKSFPELQSLKLERDKLREVVKRLIPLAEDGFKLHVSNTSHQEFLQEDIDDLKAASEALSLTNKQE